MKNNSALAFQGQSTLDVYGLKMADQSRISVVGSRNDLTVQLHQTLEMSSNAAIGGYLQARYVKTFHHGVFFIAEQGPFRFEHGAVCYEAHQGNALRSLAEINRQVRDLQQFRP